MSSIFLLQLRLSCALSHSYLITLYYLKQPSCYAFLFCLSLQKDLVFPGCVSTMGLYSVFSAELFALGSLGLDPKPTSTSAC